MTEQTINMLRKEKVSKEHEAILSHVKGLVKMSRSSMSKCYSDWDLMDQVYRGEKEPDREDKEQARKGKPIKMVVPNTYAQVHTFSSFLFLMFKQNRTFFELNPTGEEDFGTKRRDCESVLERDLRQNQWNRVLFQHLTDVARFGPAFLECSWVRKTTRAFVDREPMAVTFGGQQHEIRPGTEWAEFVKYEGNEVKPVSPYRFFPDTRLPLVDFQNGEFCASEEEYSMGMLRDMEKSGEVAGVDRIEKFVRNGLSSDLRGGPTRTLVGIDEGAKRWDGWLRGPSQSEGTTLVTKVQVRLIPTKFEVEPGKKLGPEDFRILHHVWYANDNRIIKIEPAMFWHDRFGWASAQFTPDMHRTVNLGLADLIYRLQDVITWHINSRITDVRRNMRGRNIVDPAGVEMSSLNGDGDVFLRQSASKSGVDRWIKPLQTVDVTSGHMTDADMLGKIMEVVTGVNGNAMGQYNSGRRSAQEARVVTAGAAGRMKMHGHLIWDGSLGPIGQMMLSNGRQSLSQESFARVVGQMKDDQPTVDPVTMQPVPGRSGADKMAERYAAFKGTPDEVICGDDYMMFDSTLASEKGFMAQGLNELLSVLLSNPMTAQQFDIDPKAVLGEMQELRDGSPVSRFSFAQRAARGESMPPPMALPQPAAGGQL